MIIKRNLAVLLIAFSLNARADEPKGLAKLLPKNWGKSKVEKTTPVTTDMIPTPIRSRMSIPTNTRQQQAEAMVDQRAAKTTSKQRALTPEESNLRLPNFFTQNGNPDIPTVKTEDGTYITESLFTGIATHEAINDATFHGFKLSDLIGDAPDLSSLQDMAHTGLIAYFAEHPMTGGTRDRGYRPQFIPSFVRFVTETYPLMLESGELLYPKERSLQYIATGESPDKEGAIDFNLKVAFNRAQIAMTDTDGNILGPNMYPIFGEAKVDSENKIYFTSDQWQEMASYSKGFESFLSQQVLMAFPLPKYSNVYQGAPFEDAQARRTAREELFTVTPLTDCIKLMAKLKFKTARECFDQRKDEKMYRELTGAENYSTLKDFKDAAIRGAIAGGIVTEISGAMDLGTGIGVGVLANTMRVAYNRYLRKEDQFTQEQFDSLMSMINMYTFAPGPDGIIHPKKGMWKVLENGIIYRYRSEAVITGYSRDAKGKRMAVTGMKDFPMDLYGKDQTAEVGFRIHMDKKANPDTGPIRAYGHLEDIRRSESRAARKAAAQLKALGGSSDEDEPEVPTDKEVREVQPERRAAREEAPAEEEATTTPAPAPKAATQEGEEISFPPIPKVSKATKDSMKAKPAVEVVKDKTPAASTTTLASNTHLAPEAQHTNTMSEVNPLLPALNGNPPKTLRDLEELQRNLPIPPAPPKAASEAQPATPPKELNVTENT